MTTFKDFLSSNSEDPIMESYSEKIISNKLDRDRRKKYEQILKEEYNVSKEEQKAESFSLKKWMSIAASVIVLAGSFYFLNQPTKTSPKELAQAEIAELHIMADQSVMRKGAADFEEIRKQANHFYVNGDYQNALEQWQLLEADQKTNERDYLYKGICYLKLGDSTRALEVLEKIESAKGFELEWNWVIALAHLDTNSTDKAHIHLSKLISEGKYKVAEAKQLIEAI